MAAKTAVPAPAAPRADWLPLTAAGLALAACLVAVNPWGGITQASDLPLTCLALVAIVMVFGLTAADGVRSLRTWRVSWALAACLAWAAVCAFASGRFAGSIFGQDGTALGWPALFAAAAIVVGAAFRASGVRRALMLAAPWVLLAQAAVVGWELSLHMVAAGTFSNSSFTGEVVCVLAPLAFLGGLEAEGWLGRVLGCGSAAAGWWVLLAGQARASTIALSAAFGVWLLVALWRRFGARFGAAAVSGTGVLVAGAAVYLWLKWRHVPDNPVTVFAQTRWALWDPALRAIAQRPILGFGPDGFNYAVERMANAGAFGTWSYWPPAEDPHNLVLWIGVSTGVVGILLAGWLACTIGRNWYKQLTAAFDATLVALIAGLVCYLVSALAAPAALQTIPITLLALGASLRPELPGDVREWQPAYWIPLAVRILSVVMVALLGFYALTRLTMADRKHPTDPARVQTGADLWHDPYLYYAASLTWATANAAQPGIMPAQQDLTDIQTAAAIEPNNPRYALELARTVGAYKESRAQIVSAFEHAIELAPGSPEAKASYAEFLISFNQLPQARAQLDAAEKLPRAEEVLRVEAEYWRAAGDETKARAFDDKLTALHSLLHSNQ